MNCTTYQQRSRQAGRQRGRRPRARKASEWKCETRIRVEINKCSKQRRSACSCSAPALAGTSPQSSAVSGGSGGSSQLPERNEEAQSVSQSVSQSVVEQVPVSYLRTRPLRLQAPSDHQNILRFVASERLAILFVLSPRLEPLPTLSHPEWLASVAKAHSFSTYSLCLLSLHPPFSQTSLRRSSSSPPASCIGSRPSPEHNNGGTNASIVQKTHISIRNWPYLVHSTSTTPGLWPPPQHSGSPTALPVLLKPGTSYIFLIYILLRLLLTTALLS